LSFTPSADVGTLGWVTGRASRPQKPVPYPHRFFSGTRGGRKLRRNRMTQVQLENTTKTKVVDV